MGFLEGEAIQLTMNSAVGAAGGSRDLADRALAAMGREVVEQLVHLPDRRPIDEVAALALLCHQPRVGQFSQMKRQCRGRNVEHGGQRSRAHALRAGADQRAKDAEANRLGERRERSDGGFFFHYSILVEIWLMVNGLIVRGLNLAL